MIPDHEISTCHLSVSQVGRILSTRQRISISKESRERIRICRTYLDNRISNTDELIYGINTGFGSLCNIRISDSDIEALQMNLVMSHAAGTGDPVPPEIVKIMLLLKIQSLAYGHSGVTEEVMDRLVYFYNHDILPVVYELGSLGASGDLAPLAHLSLPLAGLGEVWINGERVPTRAIQEETGLEPLHFKAKEALALLNGTQFSAAYA
ncbi:MAG: aromatic amino acid lyase, partial [Bacteroidota bacterium]